MKRLILGLLMLGLTTPALAQGTQSTLSGNECWSAGQGPGGASSYICVNLVRNTNANVTYQIVGNVTIAAPNTPSAILGNGGYALITTQPAAATVTLPAAPFPDGGIIAICNVSGAGWATNVVTVVGNAGQTGPQGASGTITSLAATVCARFIYNRLTSTWYRVAG